MRRIVTKTAKQKIGRTTEKIVVRETVPSGNNGNERRAKGKALRSNHDLTRNGRLIRIGTGVCRNINMEGRVINKVVEVIITNKIRLEIEHESTLNFLIIRQHRLNSVFLYFPKRYNVIM